MTKKAFIQKWCHDHNISADFFSHMFDVVPAPVDRVYENPDYSDGEWLVVPRPPSFYRFRVSVPVVRRIVEELSPTETSQQWNHRAGDGTFLLVFRGQSKDKVCPNDWLEFVFEED